MLIAVPVLAQVPSKSDAAAADTVVADTGTEAEITAAEATAEEGTGAAVPGTEVTEGTIAEPAVAEEDGLAEPAVAGDPVAEDEVAGAAVAGDPVAEDEVAEAAVAGNPVAEDEVAEGAVAENGDAAEPAAEAPVAETKIGRNRVADESVKNYLAAIEQAESIGGAYATELGDLYQGLGQSLITLGEFEEARSALHRGVMVVRVNTGLDSLDQTNYLYSLAEVETRLGNAEEAARVMQQIYQINARNFGENDPAMLPALERMYAWYVSERGLDSPGGKYSDYQNGSYLASRMAHLTEVKEGLGHAKTAMSYRALGQIHFQAIRHIIETGEALEPELVMDSDWSMTQQLRDASLSGHYHNGADAFERAALSWQENPGRTELELAEAIAQLGDWYLAFEKYQSAQRYYEQAYQVLADSAEYAAVADTYMGRPTPLRFLNNREPFVRSLEEPAPANSLDVSMTVTRTGNLQDIQILNAGAETDSEEQVKKIRRYLRTTRFRPGLLNGELTKVEGFVWKIPMQGSESAP